ncbi:NAD(P)/FAD-dependent oxidoreductase [Aquibacillus koreensis]|uniref:NAD(P)/FAD-dependent oxidoreductase n=1 Tax=Aquibacillus koreensis TaxID=279446 RepID=A0A9X3WPK1_9BACI|nr:NAD(P)/FAD-dependent oxidoreductase [Aquibacillus koreensis]MCT2537735.1 NAD(P)/FAD-dependent oxidoreductase [Aquibacillus koreensis]MDC3421231.1 NAD(P)/FAD-dependent oxidoreductase [Aquibacillus koreensis]
MVNNYDCIIIGGGIAGIQAAIQLGRYRHRVLVIDETDMGRSNLCRCYHNIIGWPDGVSGQLLRDIGSQQAKDLGVDFANEKVHTVDKQGQSFEVRTQVTDYLAKRILFATGVKDRLPLYEQIYPCLGKSIYICPDCDGYEIANKNTIVLGSGDVGANMALTLRYWSDALTYINHEQKPVKAKLLTELEEKGIHYLNEPVKEVRTEKEQIHGVQLQSGKMIETNHAFVAFGGNQVNSELAESLGVKLHDNKHILVNPRTQMTNVEHVWAAGDVVAHSEQVTIAMGDGMQAAIWMHKTLMGHA